MTKQTTRNQYLFASLLVIAISPSSAGAAQDIAAQVRAFLSSRASAFMQDPLVLKAVNKQNAEHSQLSLSTIEELDQQWRSETRSTSRPLIDQVTGKELSRLL